MSTFVAPGKLPADAYGNLPPKHGGSVACVRATVVYTNTDSTAFAELPAGAVIVDYYVDVQTGFTGSTGDTLEVGFSDNADAIVDALDISSTGLVRAGAGATTPTAELNGTPTAEPTTLYYLYTDATGDADAGSADIVIFYTVEESD
jgi:hypothetical protein